MVKELDPLTPPPKRAKLSEGPQNSGKPLSRYQRAELATGRQPRWSSSQQLIEDGLGDPLQHFEIAKKLQHPGVMMGELPEDMINSAKMVMTRGLEMAHHRIQVINTLECRKKELQAQWTEEKKTAGFTYTAMGAKVHVPLMRFVTKIANVKEVDLADKMYTGLGIVGPADESPQFLPYHVPAAITVEELLKGAPARRQRIESKIRADAVTAKDDVLRKVTDKTQKEVSLKQMSPAMTLEEVCANQNGINAPPTSTYKWYVR